MKKWHWRARYYVLMLAAGGLCAAGGCGLSDQQLAQIWEAVISAGLSTIVENALTVAAGLPA